MKKALFLLLALSILVPLGYGQQVPIINPSFEANPPTGNYNYGTPTGWTCPNVGGGHGMQNPTPAQLSSGIKGNTVVWINGGAFCTQDSGPADPTKNYSLTVSVGSQSGYGGAYTVSYAGCSVSGTASYAQSGSLVPITLPCPTPTGELIISLASTNGQAIFDNVTLTATPNVPPPPPLQNIVTVSISATYDDGSIPTILTVNVNDITDPKNTIGQLNLTPDSVTGAAIGVFTLASTETYQVTLVAMGSQVGQTFYDGGLVLTLMPKVSQANFSIVLFKATGAVKSFTSGAQ